MAIYKGTWESGSPLKNDLYVFYDENGLDYTAVGYGFIDEDKNQSASIYDTTAYYPVDAMTTFNSYWDEDEHIRTVAIADNAFEYCFPLRSINLPDVQAIGSHAFYGCFNLETVILSTKLTSIGGYAFDRDYIEAESDGFSIKHLNIYYEGSEADWANVTKETIGYSLTVYFYSETQPTKTGNYWHYVNGEPTIWSKYKGELAYTLLSNGTYEVSGIGNVTDTDIIIPSTYNSKAVTSVGYRAFFNCVNLTSVIISNNVINIGESAFQGCTNLVNIKIPDGVTHISAGAFRGCENLKNIDIPNSVVDIGQNAFYNCTKLAKVSLSKNMTVINMQTFYRCEALTEITIPAGIISIDLKAFYRCDSLTKISLLGEETPTLEDPNAFYIRDANKIDQPTTATFYCDSSLIDVYKTATNWQVFANQFKTFDKDDYLKFYFVRNANAQKKYFASKKELADLEDRIGQLGPSSGGTIQEIKAAAGANINSVGTPSVTANTDENGVTTLTFNYLKGVKGDKGDKGEKGDQGEKGADGTVAFDELTEAQKASLKGDPGQNGVTPTIKASAGTNINTVGTPSVSASTSGTTTTFTFNCLKGEKGEKGEKGDPGTFPSVIESLTFTDGINVYDDDDNYGGDDNFDGDDIDATYYAKGIYLSGTEEYNLSFPAKSGTIALLSDISGGGSSITVDSSLSSTSTNPVQNKVVYAALSNKSNTNHTHTNYVNTTGAQTDIAGNKTFLGTITASSFYATSDVRKKENIVDYIPEKSILDLPVKEFNFIGQNEKQIGCIAQDLQQLFPNLVKEDEEGYLSIQENKLVYLLLDEVKKLKAEIESLKGV